MVIELVRIFVMSEQFNVSCNFLCMQKLYDDGGVSGSRRTLIKPPHQ